ncbi:MAG TPA: hypothetical protein VFZ66_01430 [Herpetosiphonaceae bacterium]
MSDRTQNTGSSGDRPLFQNMDEQERIYAPQQVPGEISDELDERGARAAGTEPIVPGTPTTAIDTPIPGAKAIDPLDRDEPTRSREL